MEAHWDSAAAAGPPVSFVPLSALIAAPSEPPFGFIDKIQGNDVIEALSRDRIREVGLFVGDDQFASVTKFYPRPEVVTAFSRPDLLNTRWRAFFTCRSLKRANMPSRHTP
jgi:hypothetical protein